MEVNNKEDCLWVLNKVKFDSFTYKDLKEICKCVEKTNSYTDFITTEIAKQIVHQKPKLRIV